jgi:hypothetical protein
VLDFRSGHVGFVVDILALGQVFSEYFGFPCQFTFHRLLHNHRLSSEAGTIGQIVAEVPSGLSFTPPQETKKKLLILIKITKNCNNGGRNILLYPFLTGAINLTSNRREMALL